MKCNTHPAQQLIANLVHATAKTVALVLLPLQLSFQMQETCLRVRRLVTGLVCFFLKRSQLFVKCFVRSAMLGNGLMMLRQLESVAVSLQLTILAYR